MSNMVTGLRIKERIGALIMSIHREGRQTGALHHLLYLSELSITVS